MGDNLVDDMAVDLDLNQEPWNSPASPVLGLGSLLNELESAHGRIEERIRQLEAVTARARQRQRWRQARNDVEAINASVGMVSLAGDGGDLNREDRVNAVERTGDRGRGCKRDSTHLVAKALEMDLEIRKVEKDGGSVFDCNICLDVAREPVLTCCGHLYCWACFYQLPYVDSTSKECPVCKGEVTDTTVIPIYGNGNSTCVTESEYGLQIPPRPKARRVESVRQQRVIRGVSHIPVAEALRRIRTSIAFGVHAHQQEPSNVNMNYLNNSQELQHSEVTGSQRIRSRMSSPVFLESAASLTSISTALNNAERIVEDLESYVNNYNLQRSTAQPLWTEGLSVSPNALVMQLQGQDSTAEMSSSVSVPSSSRINEVSDAATRLENLRMLYSSLSSRRRSGSSRGSDIDNGVTRESRRRRLN